MLLVLILEKKLVAYLVKHIGSFVNKSALYFKLGLNALVLK